MTPPVCFHDVPTYSRHRDELWSCLWRAVNAQLWGIKGHTGILIPDYQEHEFNTVMMCTDKSCNILNSTFVSSKKWLWVQMMLDFWVNLSFESEWVISDWSAWFISKLFWIKVISYLLILTSHRRSVNKKCLCFTVMFCRTAVLFLEIIHLCVCVFIQGWRLMGFTESVGILLSFRNCALLSIMVRETQYHINIIIISVMMRFCYSFQLNATQN